MKKAFLSLTLILVSLATIHAQEIDSLEVKPNKKAKTGYNFGILPTISYNSDLGFQYGAAVELYNYGDGALYPNYYERYKVEISRFTRGSGINNFSYETTKLFPGHQIFLDINYLPDSQYDFLGPNGYESVYNHSWDDSKSKLFYKNNTNRLKIKADIINPITDKWSWIAGLEYYWFDINPVDVSKYNNGRSEGDKVPSNKDLPGLWDRYVEWGLIDANQVSGGSFLGLKLGMMYDTRDNWANPNKGTWTEAILITVPGFIGNIGEGHLKLNITHRQYFTILKNRLTFAYRVSYDGVIAGDQPYYAANIMYPIIQKGATYEG
ncbi:MAG: BamA/TamA family outer membrane protein, partial [Flavobacteriales bacterium]|nr:BamA/TamA family outer membrane protein [Flavobacteriales bacterium]